MTPKMSVELERYHFIDFVSSQSTMHRITKFDLDKSYIKYVPDIICIDKNDSPMYFEYELDHHNPNDFNAKCSKMLLCGMNRINFIVPNVATAQGICENLKRWIETKGSSNVIRHIVLRVTTVKSLVGHDIRRDSEWLFTMRPGKDADFNKNF